MGLRVQIYRSSLGDCTNYGISGRRETLTLVSGGDIAVTGPADPTLEAPAAVVKRGPGGSLRVVPLALHESKAWCMFGGNLVFSSDSRFAELHSGNALKIFDHVEIDFEALPAHLEHVAKDMRTVGLIERADRALTRAQQIRARLAEEALRRRS